MFHQPSPSFPSWASRTRKWGVPGAAIRAGKVLLVGLVGLACVSALAAPTCYRYGGAWENSIRNKLILYFPTADDATFPNYPQGCGTPVSPARTFNATTFNAAFSTPVLRDRIFDVVTDDYCEFNVQVQQTTTNPDSLGSPPPRRNIVAVGSDSGGCFGVAQDVDLGDGALIDHARVWGGSYPTGCDAAGVSQLTGANSTIQRWGNAVGSTAAHEAGHNYGLQHGDDSFIVTGEDGRFHHIMPSATLAGESPPVPTCAFRAGERRHFSDTTFSILAHNVGLISQTLGNWDFTNPNATTAAKMRMTVLSTSPTMTLTSSWNGIWQPWGNPTVSGPTGTLSFKGILYNIFVIEWATGKAWEARNFPGVAQTPGQVPVGRTFHVGASFNSASYTDPDAFIIRDIALLDAANNVLPQPPRMAGFDNGTLDMSTGDFVVQIFNFGLPLILRDLTFYELPRPVGLDYMQAGKPMLSWDGLPIKPWRVTKMGDKQLTREGLSMSLRNLKQEGHNVRIVHGPGGDKADATTGGAVENPDKPGSVSIDLFPATAVYVTARVIDPNTSYVDPKTNEVVQAEALVFFQFAGKRETHPVRGTTGGIRGLKPVCVNLTHRQSLAAKADDNGGWSCPVEDFSASLGDNINVVLKGSYIGGVLAAPVLAGDVSGLNLLKVVCTNLRSRTSITAQSTPAGHWNCLAGDNQRFFQAGDAIQVLVKGTVIE